MSIDTSGLLLRADEGDSMFLASGEFMTWKATGETTVGNVLTHEGSTYCCTRRLREKSVKDVCFELVSKLTEGLTDFALKGGNFH